MLPTHVNDRLQMHFDFERCRRWIGGRETIIHCHHYNSQIQKTIESASAIDGKGLFVSSAEAVFGQQLEELLKPEESESEKWEFCRLLFSHLGYGVLNFDSLDDGVVTASSSHFVEGWLASSSSRSEPVCSLTQGYLQGAYAAITGERVYAHEIECQVAGAECCRFEISHDRSEPISRYEKINVSHEGAPAIREVVQSPTVDEAAILRALVEMPIAGGVDGLIPAFNVYLASTPADFYNLVSIRFLEAMEKEHLGDVARMQLIHNAETCGLNTFRGILASAEWDALIGPMVHTHEDELHGIIAVSNALGWGNWHISQLDPGVLMELSCDNGYESVGYQELRGQSARPTCLMLTGVAAGLFELVYGEGSVQERFGQCRSQETQCRCQGEGNCSFTVENA